MRKPFIAGNWKMYKTVDEAIDLVNRIKRELIDFIQADVVVCPAFTSLSSINDTLLDTNIQVGAQNLFWETEGAYTGEISPLMLRDCGCKFVIIGHSERRKHFAETDAAVNKKIRAALNVQLTPIVCVGETLQEREAEKTIDVVGRQLKGGFEGLTNDQMNRIIIAYEPVWAIGTGKNATPQQAQEVHQYIRGWIKGAVSSQAAKTIRILYGGSVNPANSKDLMKEEDIDGALVGGASLKSDSFVEIVKSAAAAKREPTYKERSAQS